MTHRVLLVDDEDDVRAVARMSLERVAGWEVLEAASGEAALEVAAAQVPEAVVLDVMMPGLDGPATFRQLQGDPRTAHIPVVMLTARADSKERQEWVGMGVRAVLAKPFDPMRLASDVAGALGWDA